MTPTLQEWAQQLLPHELIEQALESELERVRESMRELINRNGWNK